MGGEQWEQPVICLQAQLWPPVQLQKGKGGQKRTVRCQGQGFLKEVTLELGCEHRPEACQGEAAAGGGLGSYPHQGFSRQGQGAS